MNAKRSRDILVICGESGCGKTTIAKYLCNLYGLRKCISHTSREMREGEKNGVDYFFTDNSTMLEMFHTGNLMEIVLYGDSYYGLSKKEFEEKDIAILEPCGIRCLYESSLKNKVIPIYLKASESTRVKRMTDRNDPIDKIKSRIANDIEAFKNIETLVSSFPKHKIINVDNLSPEDICVLVMSILRS